MSVSENEAVGTTLLHLTATDDDHTYDNTKLEYSIVSCHGSSSGTDADDDGRRPFSVTESSGELILVSTLDRETTDRYELEVTASDRGQPSLTATATVSILVVQSVYQPIRMCLCVVHLCQSSHSIITYRKSTTLLPTTYTGSIYVSSKPPKGWLKNSTSQFCESK